MYQENKKNYKPNGSSYYNISRLLYIYRNNVDINYISSLDVEDEETVMSNNQLVPVEKKLPLVIKKKNTDISTPVITYTLLDPMHYSFSYNVEDSITIRMEEAENATSGNG